MEEFFLQKIKQKIKEDRGFDLEQYSENYLKRRINARMLDLKLPTNDYRKYYKYIEKNKQEYNSLIEELSTNVTKFFRDRNVWNYLEREILPGMIEERKKGYMSSIRIWSAGCSSGEEPYSISILLNELLEKEESNKIRVNITATDVNNDILSVAKLGIYERDALKNVKPHWIRKYFTFIPKSQRYQIRQSAKNNVKFYKHHLITDEHFKNMNLIFCRNVMIYFSKKSKKQVIDKFYDALSKNGYLIIGKSEVLLSKEAREMYKLIGSDEHIYRKRKQEMQRSIK